MSYTTQQFAAINPELSTKVSANAGTGKTHILSGRVLRLLLSGAQAGKILCLTYTRNAAAEMVERINQKLQKWSLLSNSELENELSEILGRQPNLEEKSIARQLFVKMLNAAPPARVQTIHSFCSEILRKFSLEAGVQPHFSVMDDLTAKELKKEVILRVLSRVNQYSVAQASAEFLSEQLGEMRLQNVMHEVLFQKEKFEKKLDNIEGQDFEGRKSKAQSELVAFDKDFYERLKECLSEAEAGNGLKSYQQLLAFEGEPASENYSKIFLKTSDSKPKSISSIVAKKSLANYPGLGEQIEQEAERVYQLQQKLYSAQLEEINFHLANLARALLGLYKDLKDSYGYLDYDDLISYTRKLLSSPEVAEWVLYKLDGGVEHILIDEAQDTSPAQWQIIASICHEFYAGRGAASNERSLFIVGDEKQSIYSFQGAEPEFLAEISNFLAEKFSNAQRQWKDISLDKSFRSVPLVLNFVDEVFNSPEVTSKIGVVGEGAEISHKTNRENQAGKIELWPICKRKTYESIEAWEVPDKPQELFDEDAELAKQIAREIQTWLKEKRLLKAKGRAVEVGDILILLQKRSRLMGLLNSEFKKLGVATSGADRFLLNDHIAIQDMLAIGNFALLPKDDLSLAAVLKSPLFELSEEQLFELAYDREDKSLFERLLSNPSYQKQGDILNGLISRAGQLKPYEFYSYILINLGGRKRLKEYMGDEADEVLDEFLEQCLQFEGDYQKSLQQFVSWFSAGEIEIRRDMESAGGKLRIMTVHGAKGLQAPVVVLADAGNYPDSRQGNDILWDEDKFYMNISSLKLEKLADLKQHIKNNDYAEYLRLLYVAMTRAEDKLYIYASEGTRDLKPDCWYNILKDKLEKTDNARATDEGKITLED